MAKRRKLPNGMGSITKVNNKVGGKKRVSPYLARLPAKYDINGRENRQIVGYYKTWNEAYEALVNYTTPVAPKATLLKVYESYTDTIDYQELTYKTQVKYNTAFSHFIDLHHKPIDEISRYDLQQVIDTKVKNGYDIVERGVEVHKEYSKATIRQIKTTAVKVFDHAMDKNIIDRNIAKDLKVRGEEEKGDEGKNPFTDEELMLMIKHRKQIPFLNHIIVMSFTGLRTSEYRNLKKSSIDMQNNLIVDFGIKTDAGKQRTVYILNTIRPILAELMLKSTTGYLYEKNGKHMSDTTFRKDFQQALDELGLENHVPYDCRRSLATRAKKHEVKLREVSDMLGHKDEKTTNKYYIIDDGIEIDEAELSKLELVI